MVLNDRDPLAPAAGKKVLYDQQFADTEVGLGKRAGTVIQQGYDWAGYFYVVKAVMGAGGLAMPWAFARTGLLGGILGSVMFAFMSSATACELARVKAYVEDKNGKSDTTYVDLASEVLGERGGKVVYWLSILSALGVASAYLVFVGSTLHSMLEIVSQELILMLVMVVLLPVTWWCDFALLSRMAQTGTAAVLVGYMVTLSYGINHPVHTDSRLPLFGPLASTASGCGSIAFLFCSHFAFFPVMTASRAAKRPCESYEAAAQLAFGTTCAVNAGFGAVGFLLFGKHASSIILDDISGSWCCTAVKLLLCVDLICTYPLIFGAAKEIVNRSIFGHRQIDDSDGKSSESTTASSDGTLAQGNLTEERQKALVHICMMMFTFFVAQLHDFGTLVSFLGGFGHASLAFVIPSFMALKVFGDHMSRGRHLLNQAIVQVGVLLMLLTVGMSVAEAMGHKPHPA